MPSKAQPTKQVSKALLSFFKIKRIKGLLIFGIAILISLVPAYQNQASSDAVAPFLAVVCIPLAILTGISQIQRRRERVDIPSGSSKEELFNSIK